MSKRPLKRAKEAERPTKRSRNGTRGKTPVESSTWPFPNGVLPFHELVADMQDEVVRRLEPIALFSFALASKEHLRLYKPLFETGPSVKPAILKEIGENGYTSLLSFLLDAHWYLQRLDSLYHTGIENGRVELVEAFSLTPSPLGSAFEIEFGGNSVFGQRTLVDPVDLAFSAGVSGVDSFFKRFSDAIRSFPRDFASGLVKGGHVEELETRGAFRVKSQTFVPLSNILVASARYGQLSVVRRIFSQKGLRASAVKAIMKDEFLKEVCQSNRSSAKEYLKEVSKLGEFNWPSTAHGPAWVSMNLQAMQYFYEVQGSSIFNDVRSDNLFTKVSESFKQYAPDGSFDFGLFVLRENMAKYHGCFCDLFRTLADQADKSKVFRFLDLLYSAKIPWNEQHMVKWVNATIDNGFLFKFLSWTVEKAIPLTPSIDDHNWHVIFRQIIQSEERDLITETMDLVEKGVRLKLFPPLALSFLYYRAETIITATPASDRLRFLQRLSDLKIPFPSDYNPFHFRFFAPLIEDNLKENFLALVKWHAEKKFLFKETFPSFCAAGFAFENFLRAKEMVKFEVTNEIFKGVLRWIGPLASEFIRPEFELNRAGLCEHIIQGLEMVHAKFGVTPDQETTDYFNQTTIRQLAYISLDLPVSLLQCFSRVGHKVSHGIWRELFRIHFDTRLHEPLMQTLVDLKVYSNEVIFEAMQEALAGDPDYFRNLRKMLDASLLETVIPRLLNAMSDNYPGVYGSRKKRFSLDEPFLSDESDESDSSDGDEG